MDPKDPIVTLVIDSIIDKLYYQSALDHVGDDENEPSIRHINFSKETVEVIEATAHDDIPSGVSQEIVDDGVDQRAEELLDELLAESLGGIDPDDVRAVIYMQPTAEDYLANARIEWLLERLPDDCDIRVVNFGEDKKYWVEHRGANNGMAATRRLILT